MNPRVFRVVEPVLRGLRSYHRHEVRGLRHIPRKGRMLVVVNHSLATYDALLLGHAVFEATGRYTRGLADRLMFRTPGVRALARELGIVEGSQENGRRLLDAGELVTVAPGGMREALRPSSEAFRIDWWGRLGFVRLAIATRTPVVLAACPAADLLYDVYPCRLTQFVYEQFRFPLPFVRGLGPSLVPRPVKLLHVLSEPIKPPRSGNERSVARFHRRIVERMEALMAEALRDGRGGSAAAEARGSGRAAGR
jgi:1-acyl-sn-glycerol-3-phosphate acyltransferase